MTRYIELKRDDQGAWREVECESMPNTSQKWGRIIDMTFRDQPNIHVFTLTEPDDAAHAAFASIFKRECL